MDLSELKQKVYFDVTIDDKKAGRMIFDLRTDVVPRTVGNFVELSSHEHKFGYKGSEFFRILPGYVCQGGDWLTNTGHSSMSAFARPFSDENFALKHDSPGILSMANQGRNRNGSQFFITFNPMPRLDGKCVVFGKLEEGYDVLRKIEACGSKSGTPTQRVRISRCGEIDDKYYGAMEDVFGKVPVGSNVVRKEEKLNGSMLQKFTKRVSDRLNLTEEDY